MGLGIADANPKNYEQSLVQTRVHVRNDARALISSGRGAWTERGRLHIRFKQQPHEISQSIFPENAAYSSHWSKLRISQKAYPCCRTLSVSGPLI